MLNARRSLPKLAQLLVTHRLMSAAAVLSQPHLKKHRPAAAVAAHPALKSTSNPSAAIAPPQLLTCKARRLNSQPGVHIPTAAKFGTIELASAGWRHHKAKGDYFTIHPSAPDASSGPAEPRPLPPVQSVSFGALGLDERIVRNLREKLGAIAECTEVQANAVPQILAGDHTLIAAETGCGKTLAYLVPIVQQLLQRKRERQQQQQQRWATGGGGRGGADEQELNSPMAVVLTPGRELASQIAAVAEQLCDGLGLHVRVLLGGRTKQLMLNPSVDDIDLLVGTMGATSKLVTTGVYRMHRCEHVVLDEADTLLDDSFNPKLAHFLKRFPFHRNHIADQLPAHLIGTQLVLAAATMPCNVAELLQSVVDPSTVHEVIGSRLHRMQPNVEQRFVRMNKTGRPVELLRLVRHELERRRALIVFSNKSATSDYVSMFLNENGVDCVNLNGDMPAALRLGKFERFQLGQTHVLSTTDMASRGLDTTRARHIVNFDVPLHMADYIHRIGRTGRLGSAAGVADKSVCTNFVSSQREIELVQRIEHAARTRGVLPNVNANITNIIKSRIMSEMDEELRAGQA